MKPPTCGHGDAPPATKQQHARRPSSNRLTQFLGELVRARQLQAITHDVAFAERNLVPPEAAYCHEKCRGRNPQQHKEATDGTE